MEKVRRSRRSKIYDSLTRREFLKGAATLGAGAGLSALPVRQARAGAAKDVSIAVFYPTSGSQARFGQMCVNAIKIAIDEVNGAGGIKSLGGAKLNPVYADIQSDTTVTRNQCERLMAGGGLAAATGCYVSTFTLVATEVAERYKIPFVTGSVADKLTDRGFKYTFQVSPKASHFGETQMDFAVKMAGKGKRAAVVFEDTDYGTATSKGVIDGAKRVGFEVVLVEPYRSQFTDATPLVNKIKAAQPDFVFPVSYITDALLIIRTMKQMNVNAGIFGGGAGYIIPDFFKDLGNDANYVFSAASWNNDINCAEVPKIAQEYEKRYGEFINEHAGEAYVMIWVIADAIERAASTDPLKVRDAMAKTNLTKGPGSAMPGCHVEFNEQGWNKHVHPVMVQWQGGKLRCVYPESDARVKPAWPIPAWDKR
ncbi:MAG TPA: ABC transporter substrate-binding protein [Candidatus Baltobacteraceae bacterium]|nr:ABC transporter substrate-binding protein [Candidatus Baltobacteraceae bacterium]